jgi:hypothetical protein
MGDISHSEQCEVHLSCLGWRLTDSIGLSDCASLWIEGVADNQLFYFLNFVIKITMYITKFTINQGRKMKFAFPLYSLLVYFGKKSSEGAELLRGLTLSLKTFIIFLGYVIYFYNPVSVPQEELDQKRQKKCIGSEMSEKTIQWKREQNFVPFPLYTRETQNSFFVPAINIKITKKILY